MTHPLVTQLRFARSELQRCLAGVTPEDAVRRLGPMNCLSWIVCHLANQEQRLWVQMAQGRLPLLELQGLCGSGVPAGTPSWEDAWDAWRAVTAAADDYLDTLSDQDLDRYPTRPDGRVSAESVGKLLLRNIFHYWFHLGEAHAIRQQLGHKNLPEFVGPMDMVEY